MKTTLPVWPAIIFLAVACGRTPLTQKPLPPPPPLSDTYPPRLASFATAPGLPMCLGDFPTTRQYSIPSSGCSCEAPVANAVPPGVFNGWSAGQDSPANGCKVHAGDVICPVPFRYANPQFPLAYVDGFVTENVNVGPPSVTDTVKADGDVSVNLCPRGNEGLLLPAGTSPDSFTQGPQYEIRSDGNWRSEADRETFWGAVHVEWLWCRHYSGGITLAVPSPTGPTVTLASFGPSAGERVSLAGDWIIDKIGADGDLCKGWDPNTPGYTEIHEARVYAVVRPDPKCQSPTVASGCENPNDYYVFTSGFFSEDSEQSTELNLQASMPLPLDPVTRQPKPMADVPFVPLKCQPVPAASGGSPCPPAAGITVSTTAVNTPTGAFLKINAFRNINDGSPIPPANAFQCSNDSCPCSPGNTCSRSPTGAVLDATGNPIDLCKANGQNQVAFAQVFKCSWEDPPDIWACDNCECDDPSSGAGAPFVMSVQGCASSLDPANPADHARACASACGGVTCGAAQGCAIGACHAPPSGGVAHVVSIGACDLPPTFLRVSSMADYRIQLDGASTLQVGQLDSDGNLQEMGASHVHGTIYLNDDKSRIAPGFELSNLSLTVDDFTAKKEVCAIFCVTIASASFSDISVFVTRRGHAVVKGTLPLTPSTLRFEIGIGQLGFGVNATTDGMPGETHFLNQAPVTGTFDETSGSFTLDGKGQDPDGNAAQFHLVGSIHNRPPVAVPGANRTVECTSPTTTTLVLDGGASHDPDPGDLISRCQWFELPDAGESEAETPDVPSEGLSNRCATSVQASLGLHAYDLHVYDRELASDRKVQTVEVVDTKPPVISVTPEIACLWPPNHQFARFKLGREIVVSASDACSVHPPRIEIQSVTSNEAVDGVGSGSTTPDVRFGPTTACVRAERAGAGTSRHYVLTLKATDDAGNVAYKTVSVIVPHDMAGNPTCTRAEGLDALDSSCAQ